MTRGNLRAAETDISDVVAKYWVISFGGALLLYGSEPSAQIAIGGSTRSEERLDFLFSGWALTYSQLVTPCKLRIGKHQLPDII